jgi:FkbM family methyltransferase
MEHTNKIPKQLNDEEDPVRNEIIKIYNIDFMPVSHTSFLEKLLTDMNFTPKVAYDVGSAVFHWTRHCKRIWSDCNVICFDANPDLEFLYKQHNHSYFLGLLSDKDDIKTNYYYNRMMFGGNSMYIENGDCFSEDTFLSLDTYTLDTLVEKNNYPYPDLIKMDTQGSELNIIKGATKVLEHCKYLILELQDIDYNKNSPKSQDVIEYLKTIGYYCIASKFSVNNADYDSCFINTKIISQINN